MTANGEVIGEHNGIHNFTVGQRKGLGVATGSPLYVIQINGADKQVVVGGDEHLYSRTLRARRVNLISVDDLREPMRVSVKIRHRHEPAPAVLEKISADEVLVTFDQPQRAITPGQAAVFYDDDVVVGGAWIVLEKLQRDWATLRPGQRHSDSHRHFHKAMRSHDPRGTFGARSIR